MCSLTDAIWTHVGMLGVDLSQIGDLLGEIVARNLATILILISRETSYHSDSLTYHPILLRSGLTSPIDESSSVSWHTGDDNSKIGGDAVYGVGEGPILELILEQTMNYRRKPDVKLCEPRVLTGIFF